MVMIVPSQWYRALQSTETQMMKTLRFLISCSRRDHNHRTSHYPPVAAPSTWINSKASVMRSIPTNSTSRPRFNLRTTVLGGIPTITASKQESINKPEHTEERRKLAHREAPLLSSNLAFTNQRKETTLDSSRRISSLTNNPTLHFLHLIHSYPPSRTQTLRPPSSSSSPPMFLRTVVDGSVFLQTTPRSHKQTTLVKRQMAVVENNTWKTINSLLALIASFPLPMCPLPLIHTSPPPRLLLLHPMALR